MALITIALVTTALVTMALVTAAEPGCLSARERR
jgi:hypothetical protein